MNFGKEDMELGGRIILPTTVVIKSIRFMGMFQNSTYYLTPSLVLILKLPGFQVSCFLLHIHLLVNRP